MKTKRKRTKVDDLRSVQQVEGIHKAIEQINILRKDRQWMAEEIRRLRGILDDAGVVYEKRLLRDSEGGA